MVAVLKPSVRSLRREAILDVAQRLIQTKGYEQMSVQDVQDELGVSRGAIYHYFDSKTAMLQAVIERMTDAVLVVIGPLVADPNLPAPAKLQAVFRSAGQWKAERKELMLALVRAWYSDDNALVRERLWHSVNSRLVPLIADIIRQGQTEGAISATSPDYAAAILMALLEGSSDVSGRLFMARLDGTAPFDEAQRAISAYNEAIERILRLPAGSFEVVDEPTLRFWFG